jgi:uncharacterized protein (TIGR04552 family)
MRRDLLEIDTSSHGRLYRHELTLQDAEAIRLLLTGSSVVDWQRLAFRSMDEVDLFLATQLFDPTDSDDRARLRYVFNEAVGFLEEQLHLRFPSELRDPADVRLLFLWASQFGGFRRTQILSCVILKLMHVINHMEAADLRFKTPIAEERLLALAHGRILPVARRMQDAGLPVLSFYGNRKSRSSIITKLLAKRENIAAMVFDKLRFRIVVYKPEHVVPTLAYLVRNVFPFNYCLPSQSHNNLLDPAALDAMIPEEDRAALQHVTGPEPQQAGKNEFSGSTYRMINFIVDYPIRIPQEFASGLSFELGKTVYVMVEFQVLDEATARQNEEGENAHHLYKKRQNRVVARRLKRGGSSTP